MTYRKHGHTPTDDEIARYGYQAFGPRRPDFVPTKDDFARALAQCATGDADELKGMAGEGGGLVAAGVLSAVLAVGVRLGRRRVASPFQGCHP